MPASASAPAPFTKSRREGVTSWIVMSAFLRVVSFGIDWPKTSAAQKDALDVRVGGQRRRGPVAVIASVDQNVRPMGDRQCFTRILLDHGNRNPALVYRQDIFEQEFRSQRREPGGRLVQEQEPGIDHQR